MCKFRRLLTTFALGGCASFILADLQAGEPAWTPLFNGKNLDGWTAAYAAHPLDDRPPSALFEVIDGMIHTYPKDSAGTEQRQAYIQADGDHKDYVLHVEYKWGEKKFIPRMNAPRDAGLMFHMYETPSFSWPHGVELQIQEGDTTDLWALSARATSTIDPQTKRYATPANGGVPVTVGGAYERILHAAGNNEKPDDWNSVDLIVRGDTAVYRINGEIKMRATDLKPLDAGSKSGVRLDHGKVALQAEFAEVFYRNIRIRPVTPADPQ